MGSDEINVSLIVRDKVTKTVFTDHNFWRERRAEADSNWGPSAYQPNALPQGQTGSRPLKNRSIPLYSWHRMAEPADPTPDNGDIIRTRHNSITNTITPCGYLEQAAHCWPDQFPHLQPATMTCRRWQVTGFLTLVSEFERCSRFCTGRDFRRFSGYKISVECQPTFDQPMNLKLQPCYTFNLVTFSARKNKTARSKCTNYKSRIMSEMLSSDNSTGTHCGVVC